jgi:hypothetical protein
MVIQSNPVTISVGGCNCPPNEICANSNGTCPAGSFPDTVQPGCCILCSQLIPYGFLDLNVSSANIYYYMNVYDESIHPSCSSCLNTCTTNQTVFNAYITGKLVDNGGHGICNQKVNAVPNDFGNYEVTVDYSVVALGFPTSASVTWLISVSNGSAKTDSNGNFSIPVAINALSIVSATVPDETDYKCYTGAPATIPVEFTVSLPGTTIQLPVGGQVTFNSAISKPL